MSKQLSPFSHEELMPKPEMLEIIKHKDDLYIGIPKETHFDEKRICLTPSAVAALTSNGHRIVVESGAGDGTNYSDSQYSEAGAKISYNSNDVFACNIILKVEPPSLDEI
jgi:alanine dehydrogenase